MNMTHNNNFSQATAAYKNVESHKPLNGYQIAAKLYGGILKNLYDAKRAYERKDLEEVVAINVNTFDILEALQVRLNHEDETARETTDFLYRFYNIVFVKVAQILEVEDTSKEYDAIINYVKPVYDRWQKLAFPEQFEDEDDQETLEVSAADA